ncbi:hypothetical protein EVAR_68114_1 [Eumeta japonica]|uniref:Uncharacterized protein n=1 Tax=Eumeta variegata TaxID=151549 RepID=A0A4C1ZAM9_EUMVA|nr:hypothetical protein EVAR_68114_1 [Eumeta japonica]
MKAGAAGGGRAAAAGPAEMSRRAQRRDGHAADPGPSLLNLPTVITVLGAARPRARPVLCVIAPRVCPANTSPRRLSMNTGVDKTVKSSKCPVSCAVSVDLVPFSARFSLALTKGSAEQRSSLGRARCKQGPKRPPAAANGQFVRSSRADLGRLRPAPKESPLRYKCRELIYLCNYKKKCFIFVQVAAVRARRTSPPLRDTRRPRPLPPSLLSVVKFNFRYARICQAGARAAGGGASRRNMPRSKLCQFVCRAKLTRSNLRVSPRDLREIGARGPRRISGEIRRCAATAAPLPPPPPTHFDSVVHDYIL